MDNFRAFFAVGLPQQLRCEIAVIINNLKLASHGIAWSKSCNLHITMRFLGDITHDMPKEIVAKVSESVREVAPFVVNLSSLIMFPSKQNPKIIVLKPDLCASLIKLNQLIEEALRGFNVRREEHKFVPHLTIGKIKDRFILSNSAIKLPQIKFTVDEIMLYRSDHIGNDDVAYTPIVGCSLAS